MYSSTTTDHVIYLMRPGPKRASNSATFDITERDPQRHCQKAPSDALAFYYQAKHTERQIDGPITNTPTNKSCLYIINATALTLDELIALPGNHTHLVKAMKQRKLHHAAVWDSGFVTVVSNEDEFLTSYKLTMV